MNYIEKKQSLLNKILQNTQAQTLFIEKDDLDTLESLISEREAYMKQVDELDKAEVSTTPEIPLEGNQSMKDLLAQIITIDNGNQALIQKQFKDTKNELRKIRVGRQREENYGSEYGLHKEEGIFFDTKE